MDSLPVVVFCPSLGTRCGIGDFAQRFGEEVRAMDIPCTMVGGADLSWMSIIEMNKGSNFVFQHEYQFHSPTRLRMLLSYASRFGYATVIQHTVNPEAKVLNEIIADNADTVVLHQREAWYVYNPLGKSAEILALSMPFDAPYTAEDLAKSDIQVQTDAASKTIGFFGFSYPHKGLLRLLRSFSRVHEHLKHLNLLVLSSKPEQDMTGAFAQTKQVADMLGLGDSLVWIDQYLDPIAIAKLLKACDLVMFPYTDYGGIGASAAVRQAARADVPILVSDSVFFADLEEYLPSKPLATEDDIADALMDIFGESNRYADCAAGNPNCTRLAKEFSWQAYLMQVLGVASAQAGRLSVD